MWCPENHKTHPEPTWAGLALTGLYVGLLPPLPFQLPIPLPHVPLTHLLPQECQAHSLTSPVSSFNWLARSILHAYSVDGETAETWRYVTKRQSWIQAPKML